MDHLHRVALPACVLLPYKGTKNFLEHQTFSHFFYKNNPTLSQKISKFFITHWLSINSQASIEERLRISYIQKSEILRDLRRTLIAPYRPHLRVQKYKNLLRLTTPN